MALAYDAASSTLKCPAAPRTFARSCSSSGLMLTLTSGHSMVKTRPSDAISRLTSTSPLCSSSSLLTSSSTRRSSRVWPVSRILSVSLRGGSRPFEGAGVAEASRPWEPSATGWRDGAALGAGPFVVADTPADWFDRYRAFPGVYNIWRGGIDILIYTPEEEELEQMLAGGRAFIEDALREGVTIYEE